MKQLFTVFVAIISKLLNYIESNRSTVIAVKPAAINDLG